MLEVDLLIYGHCAALLKECHPCPHGSLDSLDSLGHAFVGGARPTGTAMASSSSDVKLSQGPSHPCPPPALGRILLPNGPRSNHTSPSSSPCQKQAGCCPSVSCVGEAEKERARPHDQYLP